MIKNILHYGLQRSGTNYLENLLLKNFRIKILNSKGDKQDPLQKHFRLYDQKSIIPSPEYENNLLFEQFEDYMKSLNVSEQIDGVIIISKDPYSWLLSYSNWAKKCNWPLVEHHYIEEYNLFYKKWMDFSKQDDRVIFVNYVELLSSPVKELTKLAERLKLNNKLVGRIRQVINKTIMIQKVPQSNKFTNDRINYYFNKEYLKEYNEDSLTEVNKKIHPDLMRFLNYEIIKSV